jgi:hypothetical protein
MEQRTAPQGCTLPHEIPSGTKFVSQIFELSDLLLADEPGLELSEDPHALRATIGSKSANPEISDLYFISKL